MYPLVPCETQPLVDVHNITLRNVQQYGTILPPGIIRCNETNLCTGFVFDNVRAHGWWRIFGRNYIVENVIGVSTNTHPDPGFASPDGTDQAPAPPATFDSFSLVQEMYIKLLDNSYQRKMNEGFATVAESYAQLYGHFTQ